jgi:hypothetical protein
LPFAVTCFVTPRIIGSPSTSAVPSSATRMSVERKRDRGGLGGVEEVGRHQVLLELRDRGLDRLDPRRADQHAVLQRGLYLPELAAELGDAVVGDEEAERAVKRI